MTKFYLSIRRYMVVFLLLGSIASYAQRTVTGRVTASDDGSPIPGVNILEKGTSNGTATDARGDYSISVAENATLIFTFVGYATQEVAASGRSSIDVVMQPEVTALSEIVVTGYGTVRVKDATGAVAVVSSKDFNGGIISSPEQLIQGKTAGVQITSASGNPGDGIQLRIRGTNSIRSNNNPLFVVDGVPLSGGVTASSADVGLGTSSDTNPLNFINPNDIAGISILKDASAAAIYGSRGANGVVFITTKSGKGVGKSVGFSSSLSFSKAARTYDLLKANEAPYYLSGIGQFGGDARGQDFGYNTDWQDFLLRTSVSTNQNISYNTTFWNNTSIRASVGYDNQQGILENSYMKRLTGRINGSKSLLNDDLTITLASTYSNVKREDPALSGSAGFRGDILGGAYSANPTWPTDPDFNNTGGLINPANLLKYYQSTATQDRILVNLSGEYKINEGLTGKLTYGIDYSDAERYTLISSKGNNVGDNVSGDGNGLGQINNNKTWSNLIEVTLNYKKNLGSVEMELLGGYSFQDFNDQYNWVTARGFSGSDFGSMKSNIRGSFNAANAAASNAAGGDYNNWGVSPNLTGFSFAETNGGFVYKFPELTPVHFNRPSGVNVDAIAANFYDRSDMLQSYFARGNFNINRKYLLTATLRIDGSSTFGEDNRYGVFPSGAFAWQLHEEDFTPDVFTALKLRLGYGVVGNRDGLGYGNFVRRERASDIGISANKSINNPGTTTQGFANNFLKWEETVQQNIGVDFGIFNEKLYGSIDFYRKETKDLLLQIQTAQPALSPVVFENLDAIVVNKGWEVSLGVNAVDNNKFTLSITGNVSMNNNELKDFGGALDAGQIFGQGLSGAFAQQLSGGRPLFSFYVREFVGFDADGQPIRDNQKFVGKSALPKWNSGLSINLTAGNFSLAAYMAGQFGFWVYNNTQNALFTAGAINNGRNVTKDVLTSGESGVAEAAVSERFLHKGDFVRMQNLTLGYEVPMVGGVIKRLHFSLNAQNLFLITKYNGLDPEVSTQAANYALMNNLPTAGIDWAAYPRPRILTLGLNATF